MAVVVFLIGTVIIVGLALMIILIPNRIERFLDSLDYVDKGGR